MGNTLKFLISAMCYTIIFSDCIYSVEENKIVEENNTNEENKTDKDDITIYTDFCELSSKLQKNEQNKITITDAYSIYPTLAKINLGKEYYNNTTFFDYYVSDFVVADPYNKIELNVPDSTTDSAVLEFYKALQSKLEKDRSNNKLLKKFQEMFPDTNNSDQSEQDCINDPQILEYYRQLMSENKSEIVKLINLLLREHIMFYSKYSPINNEEVSKLFEEAWARILYRTFFTNYISKKLEDRIVDLLQNFLPKLNITVFQNKTLNYKTLLQFYKQDKRNNECKSLRNNNIINIDEKLHNKDVIINGVTIEHKNLDITTCDYNVLIQNINEINKLRQPQTEEIFNRFKSLQKIFHFPRNISNGKYKLPKECSFGHLKNVFYFNTYGNASENDILKLINQLLIDNIEFCAQYLTYDCNGRNNSSKLFSMAWKILYCNPARYGNLVKNSLDKLINFYQLENNEKLSVLSLLDIDLDIDKIMFSEDVTVESYNIINNNMNHDSNLNNNINVNNNVNNEIYYRMNDNINRFNNNHMSNMHYNDNFNNNVNYNYSNMNAFNSNYYSNMTMNGNYNNFNSNMNNFNRNAFNNMNADNNYSNFSNNMNYNFYSNFNTNNNL